MLAGGVESMSRVPMGTDGAAWLCDPETSFATSFVPQGVGADLIATIEDFTREDVDASAARAHQRAAAARAEGRFAGSVVPVRDLNDMIVLGHDEFIRPDATVETLGVLKASFAAVGEQAGFDAVALQKHRAEECINHVHTAGNSSGIADGALLVAIGSEDIGDALGLTPRARILATAVSGADPTIMLTGPARASAKALGPARRQGHEPGHREGQRQQRAIAMGHPLGATGGMMGGTLIDELERTGGRSGLCTLCVGGGMGIATVLERM